MRKKKMPEGGVMSRETPQQKKARLAATYGARPPVEPIRTLSGFDAYVPVPNRSGYQPAPSIPKTKAALAAASLASGAGSNPYSYLLNVAGAGGDLYTGTRYLLEGQFEQAADDYLQALIGLVPGAAGRLGAKGRYLNQADKVYNAATKIAQGSSDLKTITEMKNGGSLSPSKAKEMLRDGTANGKKLTAKQKRYFGYIAGGGKADNGAIIPISENMHSNPMIQFNGPSHEQGGIPIEYAGQGVEVEGQETGFIDAAGDLNVFGNLKIPGTSTKFKNAGKHIAKQEQIASKQMDRSMKLINENDPYDTFERLKFNSGMLMAQGASRKQQDLSEAKEGLAMLQQLMLEQDLAKFEKGGSIKAARGWASDPPKKKKRKALWWENPAASNINQPFPQLNTLPRGFGSNVDPSIDPGFTPPAGFAGSNDIVDPGFAVTPEKVRAMSLAQRHYNPGNIMYNPRATYQKELGAVPGEPRYDKEGKLIGHFAAFPDLEAGKAAMRRQLFNSPSYKDLTVDQASRRWVFGKEDAPKPGYANIPTSLRNKKIKDLTPEEQIQTLDTFTIGEDSKKYNWQGVDAPTNPTSRAQVINAMRTSPQDPTTATQVNPPVIPFGDIQRIPTAPNPTIPPPSTAIRPNVPSSIPAGPTMQPQPQKPKPTFGMSRVPWSEMIPEIAALFDEADFVPGQRYDPQLYQPYQVSFQDRLNENNASFRAATSQLGSNPAAVSVLAGQKYQADSQVLADEFRTNQGITNDITNKNISLLNEAQLKNLQLADTQFVRQEQAKSNTRQNIFNAATSISDKIRRTAVEDRQYNAISSMFPQYNFDRYGNLVYIPNTQQSFSSTGGTGTTGSPDSYYQRTREEYGPNQQLRKTVINTPSDAEKVKIDYNNWNNQLKQKATLSSFYRANPLGRH